MARILLSGEDGDARQNIRHRISLVNLVGKTKDVAFAAARREPDSS